MFTTAWSVCYVLYNDPLLPWEKYNTTSKFMNEWRKESSQLTEYDNNFPYLSNSCVTCFFIMIPSSSLREYLLIHVLLRSQVFSGHEELTARKWEQELCLFSLLDFVIRLNSFLIIVPGDELCNTERVVVLLLPVVGVVCSSHHLFSNKRLEVWLLWL